MCRMEQLCRMKNSSNSIIMFLGWKISLTSIIEQDEIIHLFAEGQIISKRFFSDRGFFQKTNEDMSHTSKNEFIHSFFG